MKNDSKDVLNTNTDMELRNDSEGMHKTKAIFEEIDTSDEEVCNSHFFVILLYQSVNQTVFICLCKSLACFLSIYLVYFIYLFFCQYAQSVLLSV